MKIGIMSNALVGGLTRFHMREYGFADYIDIQLYSDEIGFRKPNPEIFIWAATSLCVNLQKIWYLGDRLNRDVLAGRRAGVGVVIYLKLNECEIWKIH
ncbi:MAG: HAD family hydrolase [Desulfobacterales bacterium]|nr:HAD family hydrolase [Desulfobacterales bacterium]